MLISSLIAEYLQGCVMLRSTWSCTFYDHVKACPAEEDEDVDEEKKGQWERAWAALMWTFGGGCIFSIVAAQAGPLMLALHILLHCISTAPWKPFGCLVLHEGRQLMHDKLLSLERSCPGTAEVWVQCRCRG